MRILTYYQNWSDVLERDPSSDNYMDALIHGGSGSVMDAPVQGQELLDILCYIHRNVYPFIGV